MSKKLRKLLTLSLGVVLVVTLTACGSDITCGEGTYFEDGQCHIVSDDTNSTNQDSNTDQNNNTNQTTDDDSLEDVLAPVIMLSGYKSTVVVGSTFSEPTCTVQDNVDANLVCTKTGDEVDTSKVGLYHITYTSEDLSGNKGTKTIAISVIEAPVDNGSIRLKTGYTLVFDVGESYNNITDYFESDGGELFIENFTHTIVLDADNNYIQAGYYTLTISAYGTVKTYNVSVVNQGENPLDWVTSGEAGIYMNPDKQLIFNVGEYLPNFYDYFTAYDGTNIVPIPVENILHTFRLNPDNMIISEGIVDVRVTVGNMSEVFIIRVVGEDVDKSTVTQPTEQGLYRNFDGKKLVFSVGDYLPDFSSYFLGFDGTDYVILHPGMTGHDILLTPDNMMTTQGTYTITIEVEINSYIYRDSFTITVE